MKAPTGFPKQLGVDPVGVEQEPRRCLIAQIDDDLVQEWPRPGRVGDEDRVAGRDFVTGDARVVVGQVVRADLAAAPCSTTSATAPPPRGRRRIVVALDTPKAECLPRVNSIVLLTGASVAGSGPVLSAKWRHPSVVGR